MNTWSVHERMGCVAKSILGSGGGGAAAVKPGYILILLNEYTFCTCHSQRIGFIVSKSQRVKGIE